MTFPAASPLHNLGFTAKVNALRFRCPKCNAAAGDPCTDNDRERGQLHQERHNRAVDLFQEFGTWNLAAAADAVVQPADPPA